MKILLIIALCCTNTWLFAQHIEIIKQTNEELIFDFKIDSSSFNTLLKSQKEVNFNKYFYCDIINKLPILPIFNYAFTLKNKSIKYDIIEEKQYSIQNIYIKLGKIPNKRKEIDSLKKIEYYQSKIKLGSPYQFRHISGQNIQIRPVKYNIDKNTLTISNYIRIKISFSIPYDNNTSHYSALSNYTFSNEVLNKPISTKKEKTLNPSKSEILIITQPENIENAYILQKWKNQKGIKTTIFNLNNEKNPVTIKKNIISKTATNPSIKYLILFGKHSEIPSYNYGYIDGDNYYSDSYYGQLTNDLYPELFVGRISGDTSQIKNIVLKSINYEKAIFDGDWISQAIGVGSNEGLGEGDNGESDWQHLRKIKNKLIPFGYTKVYEFYDGSQGEQDAAGTPTSSDIITAINAGVGFFNYTGHGDKNLMLTSQLNSTDVKKLVNYNKNPFVISVACNNGKYTDGNGCIAEAFLNSTNDTLYSGAIGFCGSSILMDWAPPMLTQDEIVNAIVSSDTKQINYSIGELFYSAQAKMMDKYQDLGNGVMQTWVLFGDPSVDLKTRKPDSIYSLINYNYLNQELEINLLQNNVLVGISKNGEFIQSELLSNGKNIISLDSNLVDSVLITFTKPNHNAAQKIIEPKSTKLNKNQSHLISIYPNPLSSEKREFQLSSDEIIREIKIFNQLGSLISYYIPKSSHFIINLDKTLSKGVYILEITLSDNSEIHKKIIVE
jgi:gingipain R